WPMRADMPPGHVRAFDVRSGALRWTFHSIPRAGDFGYDTWHNGSADTVGGVNVWTVMSADEELGYVYLPFSPAANDYYGGERPGDRRRRELGGCGLRSRHRTAVRDVGHVSQRRQPECSACRELDQRSVRRALAASDGTPRLAAAQASVRSPHRHRSELR